MKTKRFAVLFSVLLLLAVATPLVPAQGKGKPPACDDVSVNLFLRDASDDSVKSDGGSYPAQLNCNNDTNNLSLATGAGRGMTFALTNPSDGGTFTLSTGGPVSTNLGAAIADAGGILAMDVGTSAATTRVQFNFVQSGKRYFLSWGSNYSGASTATVTHPDAGTWVIETSLQPGNIARLRECPANGACKSPVDRPFYAPIRMDFYRVP